MFGFGTDPWNTATSFDQSYLEANPDYYANSGMANPSILNQADLSRLLGGISGLTGVQQPAAVPGLQYGGGIAGAQQAPSPRDLSGANSGIAKLLQSYLPAPGTYGQLPTLGAMLRAGGVVR